MQPRPDQGETSYVGSGRLAGRKALMTSGDSGIGRAATIGFAREGADVPIGYLPVEEEGAKVVIALIRAGGARLSRCLAMFAAKDFASSSWPRRCWS